MPVGMSNICVFIVIILVHGFVCFYVILFPNMMQLSI